MHTACGRGGMAYAAVLNTAGATRAGSNPAVRTCSISCQEWSNNKPGPIKSGRASNRMTAIPTATRDSGDQNPECVGRTNNVRGDGHLGRHLSLFLKIRRDD